MINHGAKNCSSKKAVYKLGMCGKCIEYVSRANLFLLFIGEEQTSMAVPWGAQICIKKTTSFAEMLTEEANEAHRWTYLHVLYVYRPACIFGLVPL